MSRVKRITLGTGGTKLTDRGVTALLEGCEALEIFELVEVQGALLLADVYQPSNAMSREVV